MRQTKEQIKKSVTILSRRESDLVPIYVPEADQMSESDARLLAWERDWDAATQLAEDCDWTPVR